MMFAHGWVIDRSVESLESIVTSGPWEEIEIEKKCKMSKLC